MSQTNQNKLNFSKKNNLNDSQNVDNLSVDSGGLCDFQTINDSSRLIFFVSKIFGYSLFTLPKINLKNHKICRKFKITTTFSDFIILVTVILVHVLLIYYNAIARFEINYNDSFILMVGGQIALIFGLIISITAVVLSYVRRETVFKIFMNLCFIDILLETIHDALVVMPLGKRTVNKLNNFVTTNKTPHLLDHAYHFKVSVAFLVMGLIIVGLDFVASYFLTSIEFNSNPLLFFSYALQNTSFLIITVQTVLFLLAIMTRYSALNKLICCYLTIQDASNHPEVDELCDLETFPDNQLGLSSENFTYLQNGIRFDRKIIAEFAQIHDKLSDIVEWINSCYALQCLGVVAISFSYGILTFFSFYFALYHPQRKTTEVAAAYMAWYIFYIFCMISLIIAGWATTSEGEKTGVLLHKSINQISVDPNIEAAQSNAIIDSLRTFSQQLQKRSPIVSCGLFTYDWTLLFAIIASSATYLIILIQFDSSKVSCACDTNKTGNATLK